MSARNLQVPSDFTCGPCERIRINARAVVLCTSCKDTFCEDCCKLHKAKDWTQNHVLTKVNDIKPGDIHNLKEKRDEPVDTLFRRNSLRLSKHKDFRPQYLEELKSHHDHSKEDLENELYCVDHRSVLCELCKSKHHFTCTNIIPVSDAVRNIQKSKEPASLASSLRKYNMFAKEMIDDRSKQENFLEERRQEIIPKISAIRRQVNEILDQLEGSLLLKITGLHDNNRNINHQTKEKCVRIQHATETSMEELKTAYTNEKISESRYLKTVLRLRDRCPVYEKCLREAYDSFENKDYIFTLDEGAQEWSSSLKNLGSIEETTRPLSIPEFLFMERKFSNTKATSECKRLSIVSTEEKSPVCITSIECLPSGDVLVLDRNAPALEMVDGKSELIMAYKLNSLPWDLALLSTREVAVTLPGEKTIQVFEIDYTGGKLIPQKTFLCSDECWGITFCERNLYVTFDPWKSSVSVKVLSLKGEEIASFKDKAIEGGALFKAPQHIACSKKKSEVYVSDSGRHAVMAFDLDGNLKFGFMSRDMGYPTGVAVDDSGNVFVCAKETKNVHKISPGFKQANVVLTEANGIKNARAITVHANKHYCLVANSETGAIIPYKLIP